MLRSIGKQSGESVESVLGTRRRMLQRSIAGTDRQTDGPTQESFVVVVIIIIIIIIILY